MITIPISEFRANMPAFLKKVQNGVRIMITSHGKEVARMEPPTDEKEALWQAVLEMRKHAKIGDILSPTGEKWEAQD